MAPTSLAPGADLTGANLTGANLEDAYLSYAHVDNTDLSDTTLTGVKSGGIVGVPAKLPPGGRSRTAAWCKQANQAFWRRLRSPEPGSPVTS